MSDGAGAAPAKPPRSADDLVTKLGLTTMAHSEAFRDSPEERAIYMKGIQLMMERPEMKDQPANDIGKIRLPSERQAKKAKRAEPAVVDEPWLERFTHLKKNKANKKLVNLDDD